MAAFGVKMAKSKDQLWGWEIDSGRGRRWTCHVMAAN